MGFNVALPDDYKEPGLHDKFTEVTLQEFRQFDLQTIKKQSLSKYPNYLGSAKGNDYFDVSKPVESKKDDLATLVRKIVKEELESALKVKSDKIK